MTIAAAIFPVALSLALALGPPHPTTITPITPVFQAADVPFMLRQYPDAGYPGDLGFVAIQAYHTAHGAAASDTTNNRTSTFQPNTHDPGVPLPSPHGTWTRLTMTPYLCVAVAGGVRGRTTVMATDESVSGVGSPNCAAEVRWVQTHAVAVLRTIKA